jgi:uncharacterized protein (TIGR03437 family)
MIRSINVTLRVLALLIAVLFIFPTTVSKAKGSGPARAKAWRSSVVQDPCSVVTLINFGQEISSKLEATDCDLGDGSFLDLYGFYGFAGQQISVSLNSSAFDAYLFLANDDFDVLDEDDDGGGGTNARIPTDTGFFTLPATGVYYIVANSFDPAQTGDYTVKLTASSGVVTNTSAASFSRAQQAANSIVAAFGDGLATQTAVASAQPLPTTLAGTTVEVTDSGGQKRLAPLFFVSALQVNYLMPAGTAPGVAVVKITNSGGQSTQGATMVQGIAPGVFSANANGKDIAAATALRVKANNSQIYEPVTQYDATASAFVPVPIDLGPETDQVILILFGTGLRARSSLSGVRVTIGGADAQVLFADAQGAFDGLDQINARVPRSLIGRGDVDVAVTVDGAAANIVRVRIK